MKAGLRGFTSLLAGLKQFYRTPLLQLSDIDLNGLVQSTLRSVEPQLNQRHIHLETSLEASLPAIKCDAEKIKGVILNLIVNAIEAVDDGGHIAVRTSATESGEKGASIKLSVTDNGCGIEEKDLARVFYPFYSTKGGGSGLGLAIASNVVSAHGGTMSVESQPRQATTFTAILKPGGPGDGENPVDGR
jgi:signal transduction histidine kinase